MLYRIMARNIEKRKSGEDPENAMKLDLIMDL